jgi:hypothetical protein
MREDEKPLCSNVSVGLEEVDWQIAVNILTNLPVTQ